MHLASPWSTECRKRTGSATQNSMCVVLLQARLNLKTICTASMADTTGAFSAILTLRKLLTANRFNSVEVITDHCRAMLCKRGLCCHAVSVCVSVCPSVTFVNSIKTSNHIFRLFSLSGSQTILFRTKRVAIFRRETLNGGVECRWGRQKSRFWANIWLHRVLWTVWAVSAINSAATDHG